MPHTTLQSLGFDPSFLPPEPLPEGVEPARVIAQDRDRFRLAAAGGECRGEPSGALRRTTGEWPAVGDWVLMRPGDPAVLTQVLPRRSKLSRQVAGRQTLEQVVAANLDFVFAVTSCGQDRNLRRIERALPSLWNSGATPVILLNKCDLAEEAGPLVREVEAVAPGVEVLAVSAVTGAGVERISTLLVGCRTGVLVGSSGVGKTTLTARLLGAVAEAGPLRTDTVREDDEKGRHTTTRRQLFTLPGGGLLIDTPGVREWQLWETGDGIEATFPEVEERAVDCRYRDCAHASEPGCAVRAALESGDLDRERFESFLKLRREQEWLERRRDPLARREEERRTQRMIRGALQWQKWKRGDGGGR